jgi:hypothetical protein
MKNLALLNVLIQYLNTNILICYLLAVVLVFWNKLMSCWGFVKMGVRKLLCCCFCCKPKKVKHTHRGKKTLTVTNEHGTFTAQKTVHEVNGQVKSASQSFTRSGPDGETQNFSRKYGALKN